MKETQYYFAVSKNNSLFIYDSEKCNFTLYENHNDESTEFYSSIESAESDLQLMLDKANDEFNIEFELRLILNRLDHTFAQNTVKTYVIKNDKIYQKYYEDSLSVALLTNNKNEVMMGEKMTIEFKTKSGKKYTEAALPDRNEKFPQGTVADQIEYAKKLREFYNAYEEKAKKGKTDEK